MRLVKNNKARILGATALLAMAHSTTAAAPICRTSAELAVDADGAPDSYRVDGKGLSYTCDGVFAIVAGVPQTQRNNPRHWQELCNQYWERAKATGDYSKVKIVGFLRNGRGPVIQGAGDPFPGAAYVTTTSLVVPGTPEGTQRHYVNASEIPYIVGAFPAASGMRLGDVLAVYRPRTGRLAFAVWGDCCSLGEGSVRLHQDLGNNPIRIGADGTRRAKVGVADKIAYLLFPGRHTQARLDSTAWRQEIQTKGQSALAAAGGVDRLKLCAHTGH